MVQSYNLFAKAKPEIQGQFVNGLGGKIQTFAGGYKRSMLSNDEIDLVRPMKEKCVYYVVISDTDTSNSALSSLFFSLCFMQQSRYSDGLSKAEKEAQLPVRYILDEYANTGGINGLDVRISTTRSRKIWLSIILQDINQLNGMYGDDKAATILNNCYIKGLLATTDEATAKYFSTLLGTQTVISKNESNDEGTADILHLRKERKVTFSENKANLMNPEDFINGALGRDEIIVVFSSQPPVKLKKCFAEMSGELLHPLERKAKELGERLSRKHKPKWRKREEEEKKNSEYDEVDPAVDFLDHEGEKEEIETVQKAKKAKTEETKKESEPETEPETKSETKPEEKKEPRFVLPKAEESPKANKRKTNFLNTGAYNGKGKGSGIITEKVDNNSDDLALF